MAEFNGKVLVTGASGQTGSRVVRTLQAKGIPAWAMVREAAKGGALQGPGVEIVVGNPLEGADLRRALSGVNAVISVLGVRGLQNPEEMEAVEHHYIKALVEAAKQVGIAQIVLCTSLGTDKPEKYPYLAKVLEAKRRGEQVLEQSNLPYTIVRPGGLNNEAGGQGVLAVPSLEGSGAISRDDVAEVLVQALLQPQAHNKIIEIINQPDAGPANRPGLFG